MLAACGQVGTVLGYSAPFVGAFSDQLPERWAKRFGRRRPFIVAGTFIGTISCYITYNAVYRRPLTKWVYAELLFSSEFATAVASSFRLSLRLSDANHPPLLCTPKC